MNISQIPRSLSRRMFARLYRTFFLRNSEVKRSLPLHPVSDEFGSDRGLPIDRYYIERFLGQRRRLIAGDVLEVAESKYTDRYGTGVLQKGILHYDGVDCPEATIVGDLTDPELLPEAAFDCFICTQTFQYLYDYEAGIRSTHRLLRPGGVLLATLPTVSRRSVNDTQSWREYWRFTSAAVRRGFSEVYGTDNIVVEPYGNVMAASAFLLGLATHEIGRRKLDYYDPNFQVMIGVVARKK